MKTRDAIFLALTLIVAALTGANVASRYPASPAVSAAQNNQAIVGVWRGQMDGLPYLTLNVTDENGNLAGAVVFYLHKREPGQPVTSTAGDPEPLMNLRFDGSSLTFEVSHRRAHPPASLNSEPMKFKLQMTGNGKGNLTNESEQSPALALEKSAY